MSIFVGSLPAEVTEKDLEEHFGRFGRLTKINLKNGYAFLEFDGNLSS